MTETVPSSSAQMWSAIDAEKRRDQVLRRVNIGAWSVTFVIVLLYAAIIGMQFARAVQLQAVGLLQPEEVFARVIPLVMVLGMLGLLIATLTTVGIFLRSRTASLTEIQLRLAALESMLSSRTD